MSEDYVHKDTFEESLRRMEALNTASEARHQAKIEEMRGEVKEMRAEFRAAQSRIELQVNSFNERISDIARRIDRFITMGTVFIGLATLVFTGVQLYLASR